MASKMGVDYNEHAGRDNGVCNASLSEHSHDADGVADDCECGRTKSRAGNLSRGSAAEPAGSDQRDPWRRVAVIGRRRWWLSVQLGRRDPRDGVVCVLLRLHRHAHTRRRVGAKDRRKAHHGLRDILHVYVDDTDARDSALWTDSPDGFAFHRRPRRSNNTPLTLYVLPSRSLNFQSQQY